VVKGMAWVAALALVPAMAGCEASATFEVRVVVDHEIEILTLEVSTEPVNSIRGRGNLVERRFCTKSQPSGLGGLPHSRVKRLSGRASDPRSLSMASRSGGPERIRGQLPFSTLASGRAIRDPSGRPDECLRVAADCPGTSSIASAGFRSCWPNAS